MQRLKSKRRKKGKGNDFSPDRTGRRKLQAEQHLGVKVGAAITVRGAVQINIFPFVMIACLGGGKFIF